MKSEATTAQNRLLICCRGEVSVRWKQWLTIFFQEDLLVLFFGRAPRIILKKRVASFLWKF
ncbi:hypothetical protein FNL55_04690 [Tardiphaga sp. vice352]|uniref:hypothetical protein n=1 Tax=unclassified Tardiphaga TaxID=2631404 RepID=UPI0011630D11|nr:MULTISPECIES: hypothetical protein [unclassified Tardiphaga]QDM15348.1 hypothetical protein FNL53_04755 [Tardiphaga sp. vice278]QDM20431.1 hypothetical protein FIU28_04065 [Tardiphaga sp. vice154]QDM25517.1 hypothetical protein FNL56_04610 [Tardiphaga sp. vice304]QDM30726.1 hypothetical protein FNL55_04690 [Tardiphaga sp. vice352]